MILTEKLYLTEDRKSVVRDGDKRAAFLLGVAGTKIRDTDAKRLGLLPEPEAVINQVTSHEPEISTQEAPITHRDGSTGRRRGKH
jgi:hypothetical protein